MRRTRSPTCWKCGWTTSRSCIARSGCSSAPSPRRYSSSAGSSGWLSAGPPQIRLLLLSLAERELLRRPPQLLEERRVVPFPLLDVVHRGDQVVARRQRADVVDAGLIGAPDQDAARLRLPVLRIARERDHRERAHARAARVAHRPRDRRRAVA